MCRYTVWSIIIVGTLLVSRGAFYGKVNAAGRGRPIQIGVLSEGWGPTPQSVGLRDGLLELGYRENQHFVIGVRFLQGNWAVLPTAVHELMQFGVDLIFASDVLMAKEAQRVTPHIPIVFAGGGDPLGQGLIDSYARPGHNVTGVTMLDVELGPKRLEVFQQLVSGLRRVLFMKPAANPLSEPIARVYREAARRLGITLVEQAVHTENDVQAILSHIHKDEVDGILNPARAYLNIPGFILETAAQHGIPTMFDSAFWVERGALASYGPDLYATGKQAARLVHKIMQGTSPSELPVEANSKIEFAVNLKVATDLGLTIAPEVLYQADRIVR